MRLWIITVLSCFVHFSGFSQQNLVQNGSFEEYYQCPDVGNVPLSEYVAYWQNGGNWDTPDFFHPCSNIPGNTVPCNWRGCQFPINGDSYVGLWTFSSHHPDIGREYIQTELTQPLQPGIRYIISFHVSLAEEYGGYAISSIGAALTETMPDTLLGGYLLDAEPQVLHNPIIPITDTANWVLISDTVRSRGDYERYLTIGNFNTDEESDTLFFNPSAQVAQLSYYFIDNVSVVPIDRIPDNVAEQPLQYSIYPNPATYKLRVESQAPLAQVKVTDLAGRTSIQQTFRQAQGDVSVDVSSLPSGIYLLEAVTEGGRSSVQKVVVE